MPELKSRTLGTDRDKAPVAWVIHQMGSYLIGEYFNGGYYRECLKMAESMLQYHRPQLTKIYEARQSKSVDLERMIANLEDVSRWAGRMKSDDYHTINTHVFITLWAAQEAGFENIISTMVRANKNAASIALGKLKPGKFQIETWPWSEVVSLKIYKSLEQRAIKDVGSGKDVAKRISTMFSWFDISFFLDDTQAGLYNEASLVRNTIMHRYGYVDSEDVACFPTLQPWVDQVVPMTNERLAGYYKAIVAIYLGIIQLIFKSEYMGAVDSKNI